MVAREVWTERTPASAVSASLLVVVLCVTGVTQSIRRESRPLPDQANFKLFSRKGYVQLPFDLYWDLILVRARINNSKPIWLAVDTGANINILNERIFEDLGLSPSGSANLIGGGGTANGKLAENATLTLTRVNAYKQTIASAPLNDLRLVGRDVEGLIGTPFLSNFVVKIDYDRHLLTLYDPKAYNLASQADTIPLEGHNGWPYIPVELSIGHETIKAAFMIDTGSNRIFHVNAPFAASHYLLDMIPQSDQAEGVGEGVGGRVSFTESRIESIRLGKYTTRGPIISISRDTAGFGAGSEAGVVGGELLRRFTVTIDYSNGKVLLEPNSHFNEAFEIDMSGLELVAKPDDLKAVLIKSVLAGYPGQIAGLREGDQIMSIDGRSAARIGLNYIVDMFKRAGVSYSLVIRRGDRAIRVRLRMHRMV